MKYLFLLLLVSIPAHADSCYDWAETYNGGCIALLHHMIYDKDGVRSNRLIPRKQELEFLEWCNKEQDILVKECRIDEKRKSK
jgi:hypothetical protein